MAEFARPEDWGLGAIVGGSSSRTEFWNTSTTTPSTDHHHHHQHPSSWFSTSSLLEIPKDDCHNLLFNFPSLFDTAASVVLTDELEELCKPFYSSQSSPPGLAAATSSSFSAEMKQELEPDQQTEEFFGEVAQMDKSPAAATATATTEYMPKYKRRKNQQKRVVLRVTAEDLTSDKWAWRKYGQKPIKGSPYPRSYYRCSSSKGCLARKQVEQSCSDPGIFIITYTAEHSHSQPTRRNALAGTIRHKFGTTVKSPVNDAKSKKGKNADSGRCSTSSTPILDLSPGTPLVAEEKFGERQMNKDESERMQMADELMNNSKNGIPIPEFMFDDDDDFFSCLNDLDGFMSQLGDGNCSTGTLSSESEFL